MEDLPFNMKTMECFVFYLLRNKRFMKFNYKIKISEIESIAPQRPAGYKEDVMSIGIPQGDWLLVDFAKYQELVNKYNPQKPKPKLKGLGDLVSKVAQPIAKGIDKAIGTNIQNCGGCAKRRNKLNQMVPF
jgi:hypothetical protein